MRKSTSCSTLLKTISGHYHLLLEFKTFEVSFASNFKFYRMWALHNDRNEFIFTNWIKRVIGCPMFVLITTLKTFKDRLKVWNSIVFGKVYNYVKDAD